jgi:Phosphotransferase enzyme family
VPEDASSGPRLHHVDRGVQKSMGHLERTVHTLVAAELPGVTASILAAPRESRREDPRPVLMERLDSAAQREVQNTIMERRALLDGGLRALARLHIHFEGQADRLEALGLTFPAVPPDPSSILLPFLATAFQIGGREFGTTENARIRSAIAAREQAYTILARRAEWTLAHGDLHLGNLLRAGTASVRIVDWESACLQLPVWDLVAWPIEFIDIYLRHRCTLSTQQNVDLEAFYRDLRAAITVRMLEMLTALARLNAGTSSDWVSSVVALTCAQRLLDNVQGTSHGDDGHAGRLDPGPAALMREEEAVRDV